MASPTILLNKLMEIYPNLLPLSRKKFEISEKVGVLMGPPF
jgi:hypothetical protein